MKAGIAFLGRPGGWVLAWAVGLALIVAAAIVSAEGHLIYTLDDPYIHLAVAESVLSGGYGINPGEFSSPSSSILYPFLLALTEAAGLGTLGPLVLNVPAAGAAVFLLTGFLLRDVFRVAGAPQPFAALTCAAMLFAISAFALPMTGMEHGLHVLACLLALVGAVRFLEGERGPAMMVAGIALMPLLRFEGVALSGGLLLLLAWRRCWATLALAAALVLLPLAAYAVVMSWLGLPLLPSSVMTKSGLASAAVGGGAGLPILRELARGLVESLESPAGLALSLCLAILVAGLPFGGARAAWRRPESQVALAAMLAIAAHLLAGRYGWFARYEVYANTIALVSILYVHREALRGLAEGGPPRVQAGVLLALMLVLLPYANATLKTPAASAGIYRQHYQMHRFATRFHRGPVAVNDLGWVSYRNDAYALDLWGLGSEEVRRARAERRLDAAAVDRITRERGVDAAMIYDEWFTRNRPASWRRVGILVTGSVTAASPEVAFYATRPEAAPALRSALERFAADLPAGARLELAEDSR